MGNDYNDTSNKIRYYSQYTTSNTNTLSLKTTATNTKYNKDTTAALHRKQR